MMKYTTEELQAIAEYQANIYKEMDTLREQVLQLQAEVKVLRDVVNSTSRSKDEKYAVITGLLTKISTQPSTTLADI